MTKALPALEGGMGVYQEKDDFDRATAYGQYEQCSGKYERYRGTGLGMKLRMHPMAAALARSQLVGLAERNAAGLAQLRRLNDRLVGLPGLYEQKTRSDCERIYYSTNTLFLNESEAGMSRESCVKALQAEGVHANAFRYRLQHKQPLYAEAQWWHHPPTIPELPGSDEANATAIALPYFTSEQPELVDQYVAAFEKVWAPADGGCCRRCGRVGSRGRRAPGSIASEKTAPKPTRRTLAANSASSVPAACRS
jgi:dTDP-4-amino-4,6-dideoxygalactose transaminase